MCIRDSPWSDAVPEAAAGPTDVDADQSNDGLSVAREAAQPEECTKDVDAEMRLVERAMGRSFDGATGHDEAAD
eukprot:14973429-Alexandrium_andersonii.AAC.1